MSATQHPLPSQSRGHWHSQVPADNQAVQTIHPPPDDTGRVIFTRHLWQRNMPDGNQSEAVLNKSQSANSQASQNNVSHSSRRTSSISLRSHRRSPSPSLGSKTPLTPEESPPSRSTRKRSAGFVEQEDKALSSANTTPAHTRANSGESTAHVCICQPDPKIPRPRNAFILYRQHHQAQVVAQHPGLANPEISKIIGEQWQNQPPDEKNKWKALAEEEKLRHQQQYPTYRYQPKRNGRRNSLSNDGSGSVGEKPKCHKCGGRSILTPSTPFTSSSVPPTPGSAGTPISRTLPVLRDLSLQSPAARRISGRPFLPNMSPHQNGHVDERDDVGPLSPENKRRRYNGNPPPALTRAMPPRYGAVPQGPVAVGPDTPFPFGQAPPAHPYPPAAAHARRESLPGLRGVVSPPGQMAPPPRPGMGYSQHRLSQGHLAHDRSLTLPPLQTGPQSGGAPTSASKTTEEQIMNISFRYKIKVLSQVAPPATKKKDIPRGPLIAIEGDNLEAVTALAGWLKQTLSKGDDLTVNLIEGPKVEAGGIKEEAMAQYHRLAAEWLGKSKGILDTIKMKIAEKADATMTDAAATATTCPQNASRIIDEKYDDSESASSKDEKMEEDKRGEQGSSESKDEAKTEEPSLASKSAAEKMDVDKEASKRNSTLSNTTLTSIKPVSIIANYSLHTSNSFARQILIGPHDPYSPNDHWQWTATQWRGIIGPDLTIYIRDASPGEPQQSVDMDAVDGRPDIGLFVVSRASGEAEQGAVGKLEASVLRRVGFEVSEWVRAFGVGKE